LDFAYRLADGTTFWPWLEVQTAPLPRQTNVLMAPNPPGYMDGSYTLPDGYTFNEQYLTWQKV
jgi:hypothetical protein